MATRKFKAGDRVVINSNYGTDSGKHGVVLARADVPTDGRGIPRRVLGAYKAVDWRREVVVQLEEGAIGRQAVVPKGNLRHEYEIPQYARLSVTPPSWARPTPRR